MPDNAEARLYAVLFLALLCLFVLACVGLMGALSAADRERRRASIVADDRDQERRRADRAEDYIRQRQQQARRSVDEHFGQTVFRPQPSADDTAVLQRANGYAHHDLSAT